MKQKVLYEVQEILIEYVSRLDPLKKAAILLNALPAEVIMEISRDFTEREIRSLLPVMTSLASSKDIETVALIDEFFHINGLWNTEARMAATPEEIIKTFEGWARQNLRTLGRFLKSRWLHQGKR
jgi:hypothetical protein